MKAVLALLALAMVTPLSASAAEPPPPASAAEPAPLPTVKQVTDALNDLYRAASSHARMTMKVVTKIYSRDMTLEAWTQGEDLATVVVRSPAREAGAATLRTDEGLWSYAPRGDRLGRIPSGLRSESWMGSHFTNDDLMRETDYTDDYATTLSWTEKDGHHFLLATMKPKPEAPVVYTRIDQLLDPERWFPVKAVYYDGSQIVRTTTFGDVQTISGRKVPMSIEVVPVDKPGESTRVVYEKLELGVAVDAGLFTQRGLRRVAKP